MPHRDLVGGVESPNEPVPHHMWQLKIWRAICGEQTVARQEVGQAGLGEKGERITKSRGCKDSQ